jgi:hypothetical protein
MNEIGRHKRWKAAKKYNKKYGDKQQVDQRFVDKDGNDLVVNVNINK